MLLVHFGFIFTVINFPRESESFAGWCDSCWSGFELEDRQLVIFLSCPLFRGKGASAFSPSHPLLPLRQKQQKAVQGEDPPGEKHRSPRPIPLSGGRHIVVST